MGVAVEVTRTDYTAYELRYHASKSVDGAQVRRLLALASILEGRCRGEAAAHSGMDRQTLCDWVHRYNAAGIDRQKSHRSRGRAPVLSPAQMTELRALVVAGPDPAEHQVVPLALRGLAGRGVAPVFGGDAREHDRQVTAPARADPTAAPSVPPQEDCRGRRGI